MIKQLLADVPVVVFDLDGTLVEGMPYEQLLKEVSELTETPFDSLMSRYKHEWHGIDEAQIYHQSLVDKRYSVKVLELYKAFWHAKTHQTVLSGVVRILTILKRQSKILICWTRGEEALQRVTLRNTELDSFFDTIIVIPKKTFEVVTEQLLPVIAGRPFAMIGDSYEQDIAPVKGLAAVRFWISQSKANGYIPRPPSIDEDVIDIGRIENLLTETETKNHRGAS